MATKIRLKRMGKKFYAVYRVVVMDSRAKRDGKAIEEIGLYNPNTQPSTIEINSERAQYWLGVGAQPTEQVLNLLKITGDWQKFKGLKGAEGTLKTVAPKKDAATLIEEADTKAQKLKAAKAEAEIKAAQTRSKDIEKNTLTEIALAGRQAVAKIKTEIADAVIMKSTGKAVAGAASDPAFVKEMLLAVAKNWTSNTSDVSLSALLPEAKKAELDAASAGSAAELLAAGVEVGYSAEVKNGFKVGAKNGGYYISFTDESFYALLKEYLRDKVANMLFNE